MQATQKRKTNQGEKGKLYSLQAVRALAFLGIFTCHAGLNQLGAWGASVFLVLSGFLMVYTYYEKEIDTSPKGVVVFAVKRIWKLYPLHLLMTLAAFPFLLKELLENFYAYYLLRSGGQVLLNILLLQSWIPKSAVYFSLNGVAWYLSICVFLYLVFPYILKWMKEHSNKWSALSSIIIIWGCQFVVAFVLSRINIPLSISDNAAKWVTYICPLFRLGDFAIGCNLGYLFLKHRLQIGKLTATLGEVGVFGILLISQMIYVGQYGFWSTEWFKLTVMYVPGSVLLVYLFALNQGWLSGLLTNKALIFVGNISGYAFLIHQMVIRDLRELLVYVPQLKVGNWGIAVMAFVITVALSVLYMKFVKEIKIIR